MPHKVKNGKIRFATCEVSVVHHCNLSCGACSHLSPGARKYFVSPEQVHRDLSILARHCRPERVGLLGGEPLLHPDLPDVLDAVRDSGISDCLRVVTNGVLLRKMRPSFWKNVEQVHISSHPGHEVSAEDLKFFMKQAREHGVDLVLRYADRFREPYAEAGTRDDRLIQRIYDACRIAHTWQCHAIYEGYFYRCFQSVLIPRVLLGRTGVDLEADGLRLSNLGTPGFELQAFLAAPKPPYSCKNCLGTAGRPIMVTQESRQGVQSSRTTEELLDWGHLAYLEGEGARRFPVYMQAAGKLSKKFLSAMPAFVQMHPAVARAIAKVRKIHPTWQ